MGISIAERVAGFKRFFAQNNSAGPLVGFYMDTYYPLKRYRTETFLPQGIYQPQDLKVNDFIEQYERLYQLYEDFGGEFIWSAAAFWGVPWMEALVGCQVFADHQTGSSRSLKPEDFQSDSQIPTFSIDNPWVQKAREFVSKLAEESRGRYPLGTTLMRGIADILAALFGSPKFIFRLMDSPLDMEGLATAVTDLWIQFAEAQLDLFPDFHGGVGSFYYNMWMPGRGVWLQEDAAALLSPQLFEQFVYPNIRRICETFDSTIIHLHPTAYIPIEHLLETNLTAIELHIDVGGPRAEDLLPIYRQIQKRKPLIIWGDITADDLSCIMNNLDRRSLALMPVVKNKDQAESIWKICKE